MNLFKNHYFLEEATPFSGWFCKNMNTASPDECDRERHSDNHTKSSRSVAKSSTFIRRCFENNIFIPITYGHFAVLNTEYYKNLDKDDIDYTLFYNKKNCVKLIKPKEYDKKAMENRKIFFADFECDTSQDIHRPYMCCIQSEDGKIAKTFKDNDCGEQLLEFLPDKSITYFHNLAYDMRMIARHGIISTIVKGTKCLSAKIVWNKKLLTFKDTLSLFSCKLSQLPSMFGLNGIKKELFPYRYYTFDRLIDYDGIGDISEAGDHEIPKWTNSQKMEFFTNTIDIQAIIVEEGMSSSHPKFNMWKYAEFYCQQDVRILRESFNVFRKGFLEDFNIDVINFLSISSLANEVFNSTVYYPNKNLYQ